MHLQKLCDVIHRTSAKLNWSEANKDAFDSLFGSPDGRYPASAKEKVRLRAPKFGVTDSSPTDREPSDVKGNVPFAAYIHPSNPDSGAYAGLSFVVFPPPATTGNCLIGMVVGTGGLGADAGILGRPGHARKMHAICAMLNRRHRGRMVAWAKQDPTRTDLKIPENIALNFPDFKSVFERYGEVLYAFFLPDENRETTEKAVASFLDIMFEERGFLPLAGSIEHRSKIQKEWLGFLLPQLTNSGVAQLLDDRRYVIIQGPPGTGKTRMARELLRDAYSKNGTSVQFHPNTTYETFVGGLAPISTSDSLGLHFAPKPGFLMQAARAALADPEKKYLLHIDEINRADLSKVLGEAIFLLEPASEYPREIELPYDFGEPSRMRLSLPDNLHILGTMNSADRSIAILDVAVRRRFAFITLWPDMEVVQGLGSKLMQRAFQDLMSIFIESATEDAFPLIPGHSYFLEPTEHKSPDRLQTTLKPLLEEYLAQGYVAGFSESVRSYVQWLNSL